MGKAVDAIRRALFFVAVYYAKFIAVFTNGRPRRVANFYFALRRADARFAHPAAIDQAAICSRYTREIH
jgi:hypothetical protein